MANDLKKCLIILLNLLMCCAFITSAQTDGATLTNYNETCDIIDKTRAYCPSEKSTIGRKAQFVKSIYTARVTCDASDSNAINYLKYLPNMGDIPELQIVDCAALKDPTTIAKLFRTSKLLKLRIYYDFGAKVTAEHFRGLKTLTILQIVGSNLTTLAENCFRYLHSLQSMTLSRNKLTHVPATAFYGTKQLMELNLKQNSLKHLPESIFKNLHELVLLNLHENELTTLPDNIFQNTSNLNTITLSNNKLTAINEKLFAKLTKLWFLDLSGNQLLNIHYNAFKMLQFLRDLRLNNNSLELQQPNDNFRLPPALIYLCLNANSIKSFNSAWFAAYNSLSYINMSYNSIASIQAEDLVNLTNPKLILDLSHNTIRELTFPPKYYNHTLFSDGQMMYLSHNPWQCNCESIDFLQFVKSNARLIADFKQLRCNDTSFRKNINDLETTDICPLDQTLTIVLVTTACISALACILLGLYYKYQEEITIWLYARDMCLRFITETELDRGKIYDAFISYSSKDQQFIAEQLHPQLERGPRPFRLCIHMRDWLVGEVIADQIMRSIELSRRTIIVLSQNFITSSWSLMEFRAAHQAALKEGRVRVIIILYGEINDMELLDPLLKSYLRMHTYLEWGDPWFWEKLRYAMPHPKRRGADVRPNFENVELNRVN